MSVRQLSNHALLATLIGADAAQRMLVRAAGNLSKVLKEAEQPYDVIGSAQLPPSPVSAALELARRAMLEEAKQSSYLMNPAATRNYLSLALRNLEHEEFHIVLLDVRNGVIGVERLFRGTLTQTSVYPREVVKLVLSRNAASVILAHNHPSGWPEPSTADETLTRTLKDALALIDVKVLDHIIVAGSSTTSFAERGML